MTRRRFSYWDVIPRYSGGSPAGVDEHTAKSVAKDEENLIKGYREGWFDNESQKIAQDIGLAGVVLQCWEERGQIVKRCFLTGREFRLPKATTTEEFIRETMTITSTVREVEFFHGGNLERHRVLTYEQRLGVYKTQRIPDGKLFFVDYLQILEAFQRLHYLRSGKIKP